MSAFEDLVNGVESEMKLLQSDGNPRVIAAKIANTLQRASTGQTFALGDHYVFMLNLDLMDTDDNLLEKGTQLYKSLDKSKYYGRSPLPQ